MQWWADHLDELIRKDKEGNRLRPERVIASLARGLIVAATARREGREYLFGEGAEHSRDGQKPSSARPPHICSASSLG